MKRIGFLFPGQGTQTIGMGKELYRNYPTAKKIFEQADKELDFSLTALCFNGPEECLRETANTQPAILTVSVAALKILEEKNIKPAIVAGHSLGEYAALVASEVVSFKEAIKIVRARGQYMQEALPLGFGSMAAIIGLEKEKIEFICKEMSALGKIVEPVNYNMPGQIVIAGASLAIEEACDEMKKNGARRIVILPVSAPFHSTMMEPAAKKLEILLRRIEFANAKIPIVCNVNAEIEINGEKLRENAVKQAAKPVLWEQSIRKMASKGIEAFIEVGPGKTLCGFTRKIVSEIKIFNVEDCKSLEETLLNLGG